MKTMTLLRMILLQTLLTGCLMAADGVTMKCSQPKCGFKAQLLFGGGMMFERVMGYCRNCKKFVDISWKREGAPAELLKDTKLPDKPDSLGEVWDAKTGTLLQLYPCPTCKKPFAVIRHTEEITHCPVCNHDGFKVDENEPRMIVD